MLNLKCVSVLVALVCLSAPTISRSWGGNYEHKSWRADPNDGPHHRSNNGWGYDFDSSEEESLESKEDYHRGQGYGNDNFDHFGYQHNHEGHFDHHNHGNYDFHHHPGYNHQGHENHNFDGKHENHGHHGRSEPNFPSGFGLPQNNKGNAPNNVRPTPAQNTGFNPKPAVPPTSQNRDQFARNNGDRLVFPEEVPDSRFSITRSPPVSSSSSLQATPRQPLPSPLPAVTQSPSTSTTISALVLADIVRCIRDCPATPEFNPVCGTNNVTYNNLGALECTRNCGVKVELRRRAPCPQPLPPAYFISVPMLSTERPIVNARVGENKSNAPIGRSVSEKVVQPTTASPITAKPTRFTNIQGALNDEDNIDRRTLKVAPNPV